MLRIIPATDMKALYDYQQGLTAPYFLDAAFDSWSNSLQADVDGASRSLFRELVVKAAYDEDALVGFVQYGYTAFGFDDCGEISSEISYPVIRGLYFDEGRQDAGQLLLQDALQVFGDCGRVYAFFHYFGMSCYARHGKLFERYSWIAELLQNNGFEVEHENVYYSSELTDCAGSEVELRASDITAGAQQIVDFLLDDTQIGGCEVHYVDVEGTAYLRWIYVNDELQNRGVGSKCMDALKKMLRNKGISRFDTDTALNNDRAQHYYEKNGFIREGITRSFFTASEQ